MPNNLENFLIQEMDAAGYIELGEFISAALAHPQYGYYINRDPLGVAGDFTTAPEISQMFGEVIGAWCMDLWLRMGEPSAINIIECGAGRGTLLADIMRVGSCMDGFKDAVHLHIIEASLILRRKQHDALSDYSVKWYDALSDISVDGPCIILGNEFLDALPVEQLMRGADGWQRRVVVHDDGAFKYEWRGADKSLTDLLPLSTMSGHIYEVAPVRNQFVSDCASILNAHSGAALFIDYGHIKSHHGDTLQAIKNHEFAEVLKEIGDCDLTSHIDFAALSRYADTQDLRIEKIVSQRLFLISLGIGARHTALKQAAITEGHDKSGAVLTDLDQGLNRLIAQDQMGDLFKVMCFHSNINITPAGF